MDRVRSTYFNAARNLINHILDSLLITSDQAFSLSFSPSTFMTKKWRAKKRAHTHTHTHRHSNNKEMVNIEQDSSVFVWYDRQRASANSN